MDGSLRLDTWATIAITLMAASNLLAFLGLVFAAMKIAALVKEMQQTAQDTIQPSLDAINRFANEATSVVSDVGEQAGRIARDSQKTAAEVSRQVRATSGLITGAVRRPAIVSESVMAGVEAGIVRFLAPRSSGEQKQITRTEPEPVPGRDTQS